MTSTYLMNLIDITNNILLREVPYCVYLDDRRIVTPFVLCGKLKDVIYRSLKFILSVQLCYNKINYCAIITIVSHWVRVPYNIKAQQKKSDNIYIL